MIVILILFYFNDIIILFENLNSNSINLDLSNLSSGVYIVNVEGNNSKTKTFKLAIK